MSEQDNIRLSTIEDAIAAFGRGEMIIVVDDEDRENEGDIIVAAEKITPEQVNSQCTRRAVRSDVAFALPPIGA